MPGRWATAVQGEPEGPLLRSPTGGHTWLRADPRPGSHDRATRSKASTGRATERRSCTTPSSDRACSISGEWSSTGAGRRSASRSRRPVPCIRRWHRSVAASRSGGEASTRTSPASRREGRPRPSSPHLTTTRHRPSRRTAGGSPSSPRVRARDWRSGWRLPTARAPYSLPVGRGAGRAPPRGRRTDGRRVAFDSQAENGRWDLWTIDADGGVPQRLTRDPADENVPRWSRDGRWI
jgi:dipeptidyl aminopeptidase/acylaminoacyl peptidase